MSLLSTGSSAHGLRTILHRDVCLTTWKGLEYLGHPIPTTYRRAPETRDMKEQVIGKGESIVCIRDLISEQSNTPMRSTGYNNYVVHDLPSFCLASLHLHVKRTSRKHSIALPPYLLMLTCQPTCTPTCTNACKPHVDDHSSSPSLTRRQSFLGEAVAFTELRCIGCCSGIRCVMHACSRVSCESILVGMQLQLLCGTALI